jgi:hypothetical protein
MSKLISIGVLTVCILTTRYLWKLDFADRSHPFGLKPNQAETHVGEEYGPSFYPAIPKREDEIEQHLSKIAWLAGSYKREVQWRRALCFGILGTLILTEFTKLSEIRSVLMSILVISLLVYFARIYNNHHVESHRERYIKKHVKMLKTKLTL